MQTVTDYVCSTLWITSEYFQMMSEYVLVFKNKAYVGRAEMMHVGLFVVSVLFYIKLIFCLILAWVFLYCMTSWFLHWCRFILARRSWCPVNSGLLRTLVWTDTYIFDVWWYATPTVNALVAHLLECSLCFVFIVIIVLISFTLSSMLLRFILMMHVNVHGGAKTSAASQKDTVYFTR